MSTQPAPPRRRRLLIGLVLIILAVIAWELAPLWQWADLHPPAIFALTLIGEIVTPLCLIALPIWFLFFSGCSRRTKTIGTCLVLLLAGGAFAAVDSVKPDGNLRPIPHFRWEGRPAELLERHLLEETSDTAKLPPIDVTVDPLQDFPRYRGIHGDGTVRPIDYLEWDWAEHPPKLLWRQPCGGGFAGFAVAGNVAVTIEQRREQEVIVCYDRATGKERWTYAYDADFRHPMGSGPRATPAIADGDVYSLGAEGLLVCLEGTTGRKKWSVNIVEDNGAKVVMWGMTSSPLIVDDLVIVNAGVDPDNNIGQALAAYRRADGKRVWAVGSNRAGYSSPQKARLAGREQVLLFDAGGLAGYDPKTGAQLWQFPFVTGMDMNIIQPLVLGEDRIFIASETGKGGALLRITLKKNAFVAEQEWANYNLCSKFANPVAMSGSIYGLSNGTLVCIDQERGQRLWRGRNYGHGQILAIGRAVGGVLVVLSEQGYIAVVSADRKAFHERARLDVFKDRTWNTPALSGRQLFLRNDVEMACYELPAAE